MSYECLNCDNEIPYEYCCDGTDCSCNGKPINEEEFCCDEGEAEYEMLNEHKE
mgnify:FL=1